MSSTVSLKAENRENIGKGQARTLRREGKIPAVIYGRGKETIKISLSEHELNKYYYKPGYPTLLINIDLNGKNHNVIPRNVELHPVTDRIEHADFMYVTEGSKVKVSIPVHFINEDKSIGIKRGGAFNIVKREIEILCPPNHIPNHIDIDIINLDIGQSIHIKDVSLPQDAVVTGEDQNYTIAAMVGRTSQTESEEQTPAASDKK